MNACDSATGYANRGCNSCWVGFIILYYYSLHGDVTCWYYHLTNATSPPSRRLLLYRSLAQGPNACMKTNNVNIGASSCHVKRSCQEVSESTVGNDSCRGPYSCYEMQNSIIGKGSCRSTDGYSCSGSENVQIGNNSCNGGSVCQKCKHNLPDNACNKGITDDIDINGYCNYCL